MKLQINNNVFFHVETIESLICKHEEITKVKCDEITLNLHPTSDHTFVMYILNKYKNVKLGNEPADYHIHATCYNRDIQQINTMEKNHFFICHDFNEETKKNDNVFYLTPLAGKNYIKPNILPLSPKIKTPHPVYVIQGNISGGRRNYNLPIKILENTKDLKYQLKFIGRGSGLPAELLNDARVVHAANLSFIDFHYCFADVYCVLPALTKQTHPQYYTNKLTSSMSYISGFNLPCIIDAELQSIYNLDNAYVFQKEEDLVSTFIKSHEEFYK